MAGTSRLVRKAKDLLHERLARRMSDGRTHQPGQQEVGPGGIAGQRGVLQPMSVCRHSTRRWLRSFGAKIVSP